MTGKAKCKRGGNWCPETEATAIHTVPPKLTRTAGQAEWLRSREKSGLASCSSTFLLSFLSM